MRISTAARTVAIDQASPRARARMTGVVYLLFFLTAIAGEVLLQQAGLTGIQLGDTSTNAATVASTLQAHIGVFQVGFALSLVSTAFYVALTALLYQLLKPVSRSLALIAAFFSLMGLAVASAASVLQLAPIVLMGSHPYLNVFSTSQLQAFALMFLNLNGQVGYISLIFDGFWLLLVGYLVFRSTYIPRIVGVLVALSGLGWETLLAPPVASHIYTLIQITGVVGEASLMLWLLIMGVNSQRWIDQVR